MHVVDHIDKITDRQASRTPQPRGKSGQVGTIQLDRSQVDMIGWQLLCKLDHVCAIHIIVQRANQLEHGLSKRRFLPLLYA